MSAAKTASAFGLPVLFGALLLPASVESQSNGEELNPVPEAAGPRGILEPHPSLATALATAFAALALAGILAWWALQKRPAVSGYHAWDD